MSKDLATSVRARLLNIAKTEGSNFNQVLVRYALERFLYRLSQSPHADRFLLKGALLFKLWYDMPHRRTPRPKAASENTMRTRVPMPTVLTRSGGASLPLGVTRLPTTRRASSAVGLPFWPSR